MSRALRWTLLLALAVLGPARVAAQSGHEHHHHAASGDGEERAAPLRIPDLDVLDQDGRALRFYSDLVAGRVVAINFIFTTCTTICPPLGATFGRFQKMLGPRAGRDVHLISISVDPVTDTPPRLKAWAAKFGAGPGWTLVTGPRPAINKILTALGLPPGPKEDHPPLVLIGNEAQGAWTRVNGFSSADRLMELIEAAAGGSSGAVAGKGSAP